ncbi:NosD domain-containing protein [Methanosarcina sp. MTP4]|uniref:NosD domain-containing protein n=1 Tax=Methanosarcina sp. MTP4 TaxID=1434100 RepID=UPI000698CA2C|nr:NosD domain-containing protein [Methanosarcina sp. MTP4]
MASTIFVSPGESIQAAVNNASPEDTIIVRDGTYNENILVNVENLTIRSENGPDFTTVQALVSEKDIFKITNDSVTISGFHISQTGAISFKCGICLFEVEECNLINNRLSEYGYGISLISSSNNTLSNNTAFNNNYYGIYLDDSNSNTLSNNTALYNCYGISLTSSSNNTLSNNTASNSEYGTSIISSSSNTLSNNIVSNNHINGISLISSSNNVLEDNTASNNYYGIWLDSSNSSTLSNNTAFNNDYYGIYLDCSSSNTLENNTASNNYYGISLHSSNSSILSGNLMQGNTHNFDVNGGYLGTNIIYANNRVDGKPIYYLVEVSDLEINSSSNAETVYLIDCKNITVKDLAIKKAGNGIFLYNTTDSKLESNSLMENHNGIELHSSSNNTLGNNTVDWNDNNGILLASSSSNTISNNTVSFNDNGIELYSSGNNTLENNTLVNRIYGIYLYSSSNNTLFNNNASKNGYGIKLVSSSSNILENNKVSSSFQGIKLDCSSSNTLSKNTASSNNNGIELYSSSNNTLSRNNALNNYEGIHLIFSSSNTLENNTASNNDDGIWLDSSNRNTLENNTASNNDDGIHLYSSNNNTLFNNNASKNGYGINLDYLSNYNVLLNNKAESNTDYGIYLKSSNSNRIFINYFNNTFNVGLESCTGNIWNSPEKVWYIYNGDLHNGYLGNFYSDCTGDDGGDGVIDYPAAPYTVNGDKYPLKAWSIQPANVNNTRTGELFLTIQKAIEDHDTQNGDMLIVKNGTYTENLEITKSLTLLSETGSEDTIITASNPDDHVFEVTADSVTIAGFNITGANAETNRPSGILLSGTEACLIENNKLSENCKGIYLNLSDNNILENNSADSNKDQGIYLSSSNSNMLENNKVSSNCYGIYLVASTGNWLENNSALNNDYGIFLLLSSGNRLFLNNLLDNSIQISEDGNNFWNSSEPVNYLYNGKKQTSYLGNYYSDYSGPDKDENGIGDAPYEYDIYPLLTSSDNYVPLVPDNEAPIVNSVELNQTYLYTGDSILVTVNATDNIGILSMKASGISLNFTGRDIWQGSLVAEEGTYPVNVSVADAWGNVAWNNSSIYTAVAKPKSHSSSGSSGGGGGGGSPESASNIEIKELAQQFVTNGNRVKFDFPEGVTCVCYVAFDAKRTFGKTFTNVEMLKGKSALVDELPAGVVYKNVNIWVGNEGVASPENIGNAVIGFRVEKEWLESNGVGENAVLLYRYSDGEWNALVTRVVEGDDENLVYFEAETPGYSPFAIAASRLEITEKEDSAVSENTGNPVEAKVEDNTAEAGTGGGDEKALGFGAGFALAGIVCALCVLKKSRKHG